MHVSPLHYAVPIAVCAISLALPAMASDTAAPDARGTARVSPIRVPASAIAERSDGGYYTAGSFAVSAGHSKVTVAAYTADGRPDNRFGNHGVVVADPSPLQNALSSIAIAPDGKIVVGGNANFDNQSARGGDLLLERFEANGTPDRTFGRNGTVVTDLCKPCNFNDSVTGLVVQPDGKVDVSAYSIRTPGDTRFTVVRYDARGSLDRGFGRGGIIDDAKNGAYAIALQPDGKIVAGGNDGVSVELFRYLPDGQRDATFGKNGQVITPFQNPPTGEFQGSAISIDVVPDGKLVVGTPFIQPTVRYQYAAIRYLPNGKIDRSFGSKGLALAPPGIKDTNPSQTLLLPSGKLLIVGTYNYQNPVDPNAKETIFAARLDINGMLDRSFGTNGILLTDLNPRLRNNEDAISGIALRPGGKVLAVANSYDLNTGTFRFFTIQY